MHLNLEWIPNPRISYIRPPCISIQWIISFPLLSIKNVLFKTSKLQHILLTFKWYLARVSQWNVFERPYAFDTRSMLELYDKINLSLINLHESYFVQTCLRHENLKFNSLSRRHNNSSHFLLRINCCCVCAQVFIIKAAKSSLSLANCSAIFLSHLGCEI